HASDLDAAVTQPGLPGTPAPLDRSGADGPTGHPSPTGIRAKATSPLRASGLAAAGSGPVPTQRGVGEALPLRPAPGDPAASAALAAPDDDARVTLPRASTAPPVSARAL